MLKRSSLPGLGMRTFINISPNSFCSSNDNNSNNNNNISKGYESCNVYYITGRGLGRKEIPFYFYSSCVFFVLA